MNRKSIWWVFLLAFGLTIGGIHSFGWWTRHASAQAHGSQMNPIPPGKQVKAFEPRHWRSQVMLPN